MSGYHFAAPNAADYVAHERLVLAALLPGSQTRRELQHVAFPGVSELQAADFTGKALRRLVEKGMVTVGQSSRRWYLTAFGREWDPSQIPDAWQHPSRQAPA